MNLQTASALSSFLLAALPLIYAGGKDAKTQRIPGRILPCLLIAGMLCLLSTGLDWQHLLAAVLGFAIGSVPLLLLAVFSKCIGWDDVKLAACTGFALGACGGLLRGCIASYIVLMGALLLFLFGNAFIHWKQKAKWNTPLPFGSCYAAAGVAGMAALTLWEVL